MVHKIAFYGLPRAARPRSAPIVRVINTIILRRSCITAPLRIQICHEKLTAANRPVYSSYDIMRSRVNMPR